MRDLVRVKPSTGQPYQVLTFQSGLMIRGKLLQIGVKPFVAVRQCGAPLFHLDARRTLFLQLLLKTSFCHFDLGTEIAEIAQQDVLAL